MHLVFEYPFGGGGNQGFKYVYNRIANDMALRYPEIITSKIDTLSLFNPCDHPGGRCGVSTMKITNKENNKTTILSFWDRTIEIFHAKGIGWEDFNIVHVIGGLGVPLTPEEIQIQHGIKFSPFLYPLEILSSYNYIQQFRKPYVLEEKIKKACFIGWLYDSRKQIADILNQHPLFDVIGTEAELRGESYYEKMSQYALTLSFNGNGEWCLRDVEAMGLGIPLVRAELKTPFHKELVPGVNYIKGNEASINASLVFPGIPFEQSAANYIKAVEDTINNEELLTSISRNNIEYYQQYLLLDKIIESFFDIFDLELLK
jgi:hypothetical protein